MRWALCLANFAQFATAVDEDVRAGGIRPAA
jgi:hypothetical protein